MIPIFICEDDQRQRDSLVQMIKTYLSFENYQMEITVNTDNPAKITEYLREHPHTQGIYFLDVDLGQEIDGLKLGKAIREYDRMGKIFIVTTHREWTHLTFEYQLEASDYIIKNTVNQMKRQITRALDTSQLYFENKPSVRPEDLFHFKVAGKSRSIYVRDILFMEKIKETHKILLVTENSEIEMNGSLTQLKKELPSYFIQCHQSYLVNQHRITEVDFKQRKVTFDNGEEIYASTAGIKLLR